MGLFEVTFMAGPDILPPLRRGWWRTSGVGLHGCINRFAYPRSGFWK
jgi:hypothetical protein